MVERKIKGVLVVIGILLVVMFSGLTSALCSGTFPCSSLGASACNMHYDCTWEGFYCSGSSSAQCQVFNTNEAFCNDASGCSWTPSDECTSGVCCNTAANPNVLYGTSQSCDSDYCYVCLSGDIYVRSTTQYCSGSSTACTGSTSTTDSFTDGCGTTRCIFSGCVINLPDEGGGSPGCVECDDNSDCPSDGPVGGNFCSNGELVRAYRDYYCSSSYDCDYTQTNQVIDDCDDGRSCTTDSCSGTSCVNTPTTDEAQLGCRPGYDDEVWWRDSCGDWSHWSHDCASGWICSGSGTCIPDVTCGDYTIGGNEVCDRTNLNGENCQSQGFDGGILLCASNCLSFDTSQCTNCGNNNQEGTELCDGTDLDGESCSSQGYDAGNLGCTGNCLGWDTSGCCNDECSSGQRQCSGDSYRTCDTSGTCNSWTGYTTCSGGTPECVNGYCEECENAGDCGSGYYEYRCSGTSCGSDVQRRYVSRTCNSGTCGTSTGSWSTYDNCGSTELCIGGTSPTTSSSARYCNACGADESCISGSCQTCSISSVSWSPSSGLEDGDSVTIRANTNSACNGKQINFDIRRPVWGQFTDIGTSTVSSNSASRGWTIDISNDGNYYARATLVGTSTDRDSSNVYIDIPPPPATCPDGSCNGGETCDTCPQDCGSCCGDGSCNYGETCSTCSQDCGDCCTINSVSWSTSSATSGDTVGINVNTNSACNGQTVTFIVMEQDLGGDDTVSQTPSSDTVSGGSASSSWDAVAPDLGGETNPEYRVTAYVGSDSMESGDLDVTPSVTCGDGNLDAGEDCDYGVGDGSPDNGDVCTPSYGGSCDWCDNGCNLQTENGAYCGDGNCDTGDEDSVSCPADCSSGQVCGNGNIEGTEECDDGNTNPGEGCDGSCAIEYGWECSGEPSNCWESCGDGNLDTNPDEECDDGNAQPDDGCTLCTIDPGYVCNGEPSVCIPPTECSISNTYWTELTIEEGQSAGLNIETANCNDGEEITIVIREDDTLGGDDDVNNNPSNVFVTANSASTTWIAEFQQDEELGENNPPEYYFEATVISTSSMDQSPFLEVTEMNLCVGLTGCDSYLNQGDCEADACNIAESTIPNCGFEYDPVTRCYFANDCSCVWNTAQGVCESFRDDGIQCGVCGNGILDFGTEQCDDGNTVPGDGCDENCEFEIIPNPPCPEGTTLCDDGSCSLNCWYTDAGNSQCNYDDTCDAGVEGCSCADCDGENNDCEAGLECSLIDSACCDTVSDGVCHPYCGYIDPDCAGNDVCGNGFRGFGEECDDGNTVSNDGCSAACEYEIFPGPPCPEGTMLCNDGTCSLNCDATDEGYDTSCQDSSCCEVGLEYNVQDNACCRSVSDDYCHPYCALSDPDCSSGIFGGIEGIGSCSYTKNSNDDCSDGVLRRDYTATWTWDPTNVFYEDPQSQDYVEDPVGEWHYDPMDLTGMRRSDRCTDISDELICPAQIQLPAFGKTQLILAIILIAIAYTIIVFRRRE